jgi:micrococcal nuclease
MMFQYEARVIKILDGDTLKLQLDLGFYTHTIQTVRLAGVNTPETVKYRPGGIFDPAMAYVQERVPIGALCIAEITRQEKYGRWLARILYKPGAKDRLEILRDPRVLNDELVRAGLAVNYSGGKKTN